MARSDAIADRYEACLTGEKAHATPLAREGLLSLPASGPGPASSSAAERES